MKMKFMAVNARDGENVEEAVLSLVADTISHQKAHCNDPIDPWATPTVDNQQAVRNIVPCIHIVNAYNSTTTNTHCNYRKRKNNLQWT